MNEQITDTLLMIRPANFGFNEETAADNAFQVNDKSIMASDISRKAVEEFDAFVNRLRSAGIEVQVIEDTRSPVKTDAVFPNNWITFHENGILATYPMNAPTRRLERREDIIDQMMVQYGFDQRVRFEASEEQGQYLEGTGSLILDRPNRLAYACLSPRTNESLLDEFCEKLKFEKVVFSAVDQDGQDIYHTNVMMALGTTFVVICLDTIRDSQEKANLIKRFEATGKEMIEITLEQMLAFAGNMLQVKNKQGASFLVMSEQAYLSLESRQKQQIEQHTQILHSPLYTIEKYGGGSARCMLAEVFAGK